VLVWHDLLGLYDGRSPRFVKRYADLATTIREAVSTYADDVREHRFPEDVHTYAMSEEELDAFRASVGSAESAPKP
jgi:3-methyl-2-oxobutanoate hydroxymethyltransferase